MSTTCPEPGRARGFALVSAIFILVVLAALGGFIATVATTQHVGSALDVLGARAYQSARAGTEWGLQMARASNTCGASSDIGTIGGMAVTVRCDSTLVDEAHAGAGSRLYRITAIACNFPSGAGATTCPGAAGTPNYVERMVTVLAEFCVQPITAGTCPVD